jgi:hypothetical protein
MIGAWNSSSGASIHAEFIGRAWVELGHKLTVFSFYPYSFHGADLTNKDEHYVIRCFTTSKHEEVKLDPRPFLTADYDYFVVQDHGMIPNDPLGKIFHRIRKKAKTIVVVHDGKLSADPSFYQFKWNAIIAFDKRYAEFLNKGYPDDNIVQIPYPSAPLLRGDKKKARRKLKLHQNKKIGFMFGPAAGYSGPMMPALRKATNKKDFMLLVVTKDKSALKLFRNEKKNNGIDIEIRQEAPDMDRLYQYLYASDVLLFHKDSKAHVVVSSTLHQCLGSGCPILSYKSNFCDYFGDEVIKYQNFKEFGLILKDILQQGPIYTKSQKQLEKFLKNYSSVPIAKKFIKLFKNL